MSSIELATGTRLVNRYEILHYLASGGMQHVYVCHDRVLNRQVVLKTPKEGIKDRRFKRGAEMGARVQHPNVAATLDYYEDDQITFLVEEYVQGKDLGKLIEQKFFYLDPFLAAHVLHHIARALMEAHRKNVCHRDLKPSNVMTSGDSGFSEIKLTDFGIAKLAESEIEAEIELFGKDNDTLTSSNTLLGAVPYMAPECWSDWRAASSPMDIWAFGCIAYQLLSGDLPFGSGRKAIVNITKAEHAGKVELDLPKTIGKHPETQQLENALWQMIVSCIQLNPANRPTAAQLVEQFSTMCYAANARREGTVSEFRVAYANGRVGNFGYVIDAETRQKYFFHGTNYYGPSAAEAGGRVCFSVYSGEPWFRLSPVLLLRS